MRNLFDLTLRTVLVPNLHFKADDDFKDGHLTLCYLMLPRECMHYRDTAKCRGRNENTMVYNAVHAVAKPVDAGNLSLSTAERSRFRQAMAFFGLSPYDECHYKVWHDEPRGTVRSSDWPRFMLLFYQTGPLFFRSKDGW